MTLQDKHASALLNPRAIALVGASGNPAKATSRAQRFLTNHGYSGNIYPINPNRTEMFGLPCFSSLSDVAEAIDHAFIMVSGDAAFEAVRQCASLGIPCATLLAGGFAEAGGNGQHQQDQLLEIAHAGGVRILGPNSIGMINVSGSVVLSANAMLDLPELPVGGLSVISQSGSLIGAMLSQGAARDIGFSKLISVGNEADLGVGEIGEMLVDDPDTDVILLFLETLRESDAVAAMTRRAFKAGKPVIAYKLGRSEIGQQLAQSHTGAIAGSDAAFEAFIKHHSIARVRSFEALLEVPNIFKGRKPSVGKRIGIAATTGGGGAMVVDSLGELGVEVISPGQAVADHLKAHGVHYEGSKLVDLTIAGARPEVVNGVIKGLMENPECDAVVMVVGSSARFHPEQAVEPLASWAGSPKPLIVYIAPDAPDALRFLQQAGIAVFRTPEACAEGIHSYLSWSSPDHDGVPDDNAVKSARLSLEAAPGQVLGETSAVDIYAELGIKGPGAVIVQDETNAVEAAEAMGYPVVLKIISDDIPHKTEAGGVRLNLSDDSAVATACQDIMRSVKNTHPHALIPGFLVQPMEKGLVEVLLGYKKDPLVGPIVVLGTGGVLTEIYRDSAVRLAPVTMEGAHAMIREVKGLAPIRGYRGMPLGDVEALAKAIFDMSALSQLHDVIEAEVNPLIVKPEGEGVVAVDGLIIRRPPLRSP